MSNRFGIQTSELAALTIKDWMIACNDGHESCRERSTLQKLPTRILQITGQNKVRLHIPNKRQRALYVCLSHCWGGMKVLRTTKGNFSSHCASISWASLPTTFQDAIDLTRRLGLEFIWIDSLCIVQDDVYDWRQEGGNMANIYSNSYVTLAAVASGNSAKGLYRSMASSRTFRMQASSDQPAYNIHVRERALHDDFLHRALPLQRRAWYFQERVLSARVVSFCHEELYWKCGSMQCCECGNAWPESTALKLLTKEISECYLGAYNNKSMRSWRRLVTQYTSLSLTFSSDLLPALQGIAEIWHTQRSGLYFAGIWEHGFGDGMLWYIPSEGYRPPSYRAPTWSWASTVGQVEWAVDQDINSLMTSDGVTDSSTIVTLASILHVSTTPAGADPKGEIVAGNLVIKGHCLSPTLVSNGNLMILRPREAVKVGIKPKATLERTCSWWPDNQTEDERKSEVLFMLMGESSGLVYFIGYRKKLDDCVHERVGLALYHKLDMTSSEISTFQSWGEEMVLTVV